MMLWKLWWWMMLCKLVTCCGSWGGGVISRLITIRTIEGTTNIKIDDVIRICLIHNLAYLPLVQSHLAPQTGASIVS